MNRNAKESIARALIRAAAHRAPPELSGRLEEEWLADLEARRGPLAQVLFALGCRWAARTIALEFGAPVRLAATAPASGPVAVTRPRRPAAAPRLVFLVAIAGFHAALIAALARSLMPGAIQPPPPPLRAVFVPARPVAHVPPVPIGAVLAPPSIQVPLPLFRFDPAVESGPRVLTVPVAAAQPDTAAPAVQRVAGGPGAHFPNTADFYPANARRLGIEGAADVRVCIDAAGRLIAAPAIAQSSGSALLDAGALRLARAGSGHYRATTEDGRAVASCYPFRVRFQMR